MNYFLMLIIMGLCAGGYYEYNTLQDEGAYNRKQVTDLGAQIDTLKSQAEKLESDNTQLTKGATDARAEIADLTQQVQVAQKALAAMKQKEIQPPAVSAGPTPALVQSGNILGTFGTQDNRTFPNSQLMKVEAEDIVISYSGGITQIRYTLLPPQLQKRFGFDPTQAISLTADQVAVLEKKRITDAAQTAGN